MKQINFLIALGVLLVVTTTATAGFPGPASPGEALAYYDVSTGEIYVSINGVNNWYIESTSDSLTGDAPIFGTIPGALPSDTDSIIGETAFFVDTATNHSLGNVAAIGLPAFIDLTINWNTGLGTPLQTAPVNGPLTPEPIAYIDGPLVVDLTTDPLNLTLDASVSFSGNFGTQFRWDIDGNPGYEINTGTADTLEIADVVATFGGVGVYTVGVSVSDIGGYDSASTTLTIINTIPEPTTLGHAGLGLVLSASVMRRRIC